ncbi:MAG: hypothetical protein R3B48_29465 [Kofleriaceae bacterium]
MSWLTRAARRAAGSPLTEPRRSGTSAGVALAAFVLVASPAPTRAEAATPDDAVEVSDTVPFDEVPPIERTAAWSRYRAALALLTGPLGVAAHTDAGNTAKSGGLLSVRLGWFTGQRFLLDLAATGWRSTDGGAAGAELGVGGEHFFTTRTSVRVAAAIGYLKAPAVTRNFAPAVSAELQYAAVSSPASALTVGARLHLASSELGDDGADPRRGAGSVVGLSAFVALRLFSVRRYQHARAR